MKEFVSAVQEEIVEQDRESQIAALMEQGRTREEAELEADATEYTDFKLDGRVMRAYKPNSTTLAFMLATLGRGQTKDQRFAAILNIMFESLREEDKDHLENRMLTRGPKQVKMEQIEEIFEFLIEEWFATPTQS